MLQIYMPLKPLRQTILRTGFFAAFLSLSTAWGPIDLVHEAKAQSQSQNQSQNQGASLPDLTPEQIVEDVTITFNNRAGTQEYAAPTFDPFESNTDIAGSASLRTISRAVSIEGQDLQDGAILDLAFYYNQIENNSRADRGFEKIAFLSGSQASPVLRDSRILECTADVRQTSFDQNFHYNAGFFHPYGHYYGHRRFGHRLNGGRSFRHNRGFGRGGFGHDGFGHNGFGHNGFGQGSFGGWRRGHRGFGGLSRGQRGFDNRNIRRFPGNTANNSDNDRDTASSSLSREKAKRNNGRVTGLPIKSYRFTSGQGRQAEPTRQNNRSQATDQRNAGQGNADQTRSRSRRNVLTQNSGPKSRGRVATQPTRQRNSQPSQPSSPAQSSPDLASPVQANQSQPAPRSAPAPQTQRPTRSESRSNNRNSNRSNENRSRLNRTRSKPPKRTRPRRVPKRAVPRRRNQIIKPKSFNFFPNNFGQNYRHGGRDVLTSVSVQQDCIREELLSVHIPAERLEAARFDGLTVLALDRQGQELPIFIPANYIEGLRLAISGQYDDRLMRLEGQPPLSTPQGQSQSFSQQATPQNSLPSRITPNGLIASCPAGTVYQQSNGTCLLNPELISGGPAQSYPQK